jgi:hypothetical protein
MTAERGGRGRRSDAGRVAVQRRDVAALRWAGEQYAVHVDLLGVLLARLGPAGEGGSAAPAAALSGRSVRGWVARMERAGLLARSRQHDGVWVTPTRAGLAMAGLGPDGPDWRPWAMDGWKLPHVHQVNLVRLVLERCHPGAAWESARAIKARWAGTGARVRHADGGLHLPDGRAYGVEVELHTKQAHRYAAAVADRDPAWTAGVWWFTPAGQVDRLAARLAQVGAAGHEVLALPGGVLG